MQRTEISFSTARRSDTGTRRNAIDSVGEESLEVSAGRYCLLQVYCELYPRRESYIDRSTCLERLVAKVGDYKVGKRGCSARKLTGEPGRGRVCCALPLRGRCCVHSQRCYQRADKRDSEHENSVHLIPSTQRRGFTFHTSNCRPLIPHQKGDTGMVSPNVDARQSDRDGFSESESTGTNYRTMSLRTLALC